MTCKRSGPVMSAIRKLSRSSSRLVRPSAFQHWPDWAANAIGSDKPACRRLDRLVRHLQSDGEESTSWHWPRVPKRHGVREE
jgi:hypothetical protein